MVCCEVATWIAASDHKLVTSEIKSWVWLNTSKFSSNTVSRQDKVAGLYLTTLKCSDEMSWINGEVSFMFPSASRVDDAARRRILKVVMYMCNCCLLA